MYEGSITQIGTVVFGFRWPFHNLTGSEGVDILRNTVTLTGSGDLVGFHSVSN
jgi:hypothetical protein